MINYPMTRCILLGNPVKCEYLRGINLNELFHCCSRIVRIHALITYGNELVSLGYLATRCSHMSFSCLLSTLDAFLSAEIHCLVGLPATRACFDIQLRELRQLFLDYHIMRPFHCLYTILTCF